jgi:hypothetical protein
MLFFTFGIFESFDLRFGFLFAYSVRQLGLHLPFLIAGVATELGEILEPESQQKVKNIAGATIRHRFNAPRCLRVDNAAQDWSFPITLL